MTALLASNCVSDAIPLAESESLGPAMMAAQIASSGSTPTGGAETSRKTINCAPRLFNCMFGDDMISETLSSEARADRQALDAGAVGANSQYWHRIRERFIDSSFDSGGVCVPYLDNIFSDAGINPDPASCQQHSVKKLYDIFDRTRRCHAKALVNWTKSGTHDRDFANFCDPVNLKLNDVVGVRSTDILYLHAWTQLRGILNQKRENTIHLF